MRLIIRDVSPPGANGVLLAFHNEQIPHNEAHTLTSVDSGAPPRRLPLGTRTPATGKRLARCDYPPRRTASPESRRDSPAGAGAAARVAGRADAGLGPCQSVPGGG